MLTRGVGMLRATTKVQLWGFLAILLIPTACNRPPSASNTVLHVAVREGLEAAGIRTLAAEFGKRRGMKVVVQAFGRDNYEVDTTNDLLSERPQYDVAFFIGTLVPQNATRRVLSSIKR